MLKFLPIHIKPGKFKRKLINLSRLCVYYRFKADNEIKGFLSWIEREWGVTIVDLDQHSKLQEYWRYCFNDILKIARHNKNKIKITPSSRGFQSRLKKEYEISKKRIENISKKILSNELFINAIVFKLYNLTICEMKIVLDYLLITKEEKLEILDKYKKIK